jgi:hypothetical protein
MSKPLTFEYQQTLTQRSKNPKNKGINSHLHLVALEVSEYVGEPQKFAMGLGIVKRVGPAKMTALLKQMRERAIKSARYLMACTKQK